MLRRKTTNDAGARLGELYREHSTAVFAYAFHLLGSREEAEDVTQVAFLHAHRALERGEELVSPRAWLSTVVKRQAYNRWRDRTPAGLETDVRDRPTDGAQEAAERLAEVRAVLFSLPEAQHQAFVLRHWSGLGPREIAEVLGTSESAVESLLVRARAAVVSSGPVAAACVEIRELLAAGTDLGRAHRDHVRGCRGCRRAHERLTRIAAAAVVLGLVPRVHVAQALAATVPGFAAGGGAGVATGAGVAAKVTAAKLAASVVVGAVAVTAVAPVAWHHLRHHGTPPVARPAVHRGARPASDRSGLGARASVAVAETGEDVRATAGSSSTAVSNSPPPRRVHHHRQAGAGASPTAGTAGSGDNGPGQDTGGDGQSGGSPPQSGDAGNTSGDGNAQGGDGGQSTSAGDGDASGSTTAQGSAGSSGGSQSDGGSGSGSDGQ